MQNTEVNKTKHHTRLTMHVKDRQRHETYVKNHLAKLKKNHLYFQFNDKVFFAKRTFFQKMVLP